jgi:fatty-acyl-CoA synthase
MPPSIEHRRSALEARHPVWRERTLAQYLEEAAEEFGDRPVVITDERTMTYAEVRDEARRLADGLATLGVRPGDRVGIVMANYPEFVPVKFAVAYAGAVAIPFNYLYRRDELAYVLAQSRCNALVTMTGFAGLDYLGMLDDIAPGWDIGTQAALPELRSVARCASMPAK